MPEKAKKATTPRKPRAAAPAKAATNGAAPAKTTARKKATNGTVTEIPKVTHEQIAVLAHTFWIERGFKHGHDAEDWFRAEQTLIGKAS